LFANLPITDLFDHRHMIPGMLGMPVSQRVPQSAAFPRGDCFRSEFHGFD
jgi:hypothetical protein